MSVGAAAGLRGPPLPWRAVSVHEAVLTLGLSADENVLDVLNYQVYGHCKTDDQMKRECSKTKEM